MIERFTTPSFSPGFRVNSGGRRGVYPASLPLVQTALKGREVVADSAYGTKTVCSRCTARVVGRVRVSPGCPGCSAVVHEGDGRRESQDDPVDCRRLGLGHGSDLRPGRGLAAL